MKLADLLEPGAPFVAQWIADADASSTALWTLRGQDAASKVFIGVLRGKRMRNREGLFDQFGALLQFPDYFGENWDAFLDCMRDLSWLRADGLVLVLWDAASVLADADPKALDILIDIFEDAGGSSAGDEADAGIPFHIVLHATPEQASSLQARLTAVGREIPILDGAHST